MKDPEEYVPLVNCIMSSKDPGNPASTDVCMTVLGIKSTTAEKISSCASSQHGEGLLHDQGVATRSLDPPLDFVPWITFNDAS